MNEKNYGVENLEEIENESVVGEGDSAGGLAGGSGSKRDKKEGVVTVDTNAGLQQELGGDKSAPNIQLGYTLNDKSGSVWFGDDAKDGANARLTDSSSVESVTHSGVVTACAVRNLNTSARTNEHLYSQTVISLPLLQRHPKKPVLTS